jgi:hypothetical protein
MKLLLNGQALKQKKTGKLSILWKKNLIGLTLDQCCPKMPDVVYTQNVASFPIKKLIIFPIPGIEPGPPGWEPGILTTRPYRIAGERYENQNLYKSSMRGLFLSH